MNLKTLFLIPILIVTLSCTGSKDNQTGNSILINLEKTKDVGPFLRILNPFTNIDSIPSNLIGVPQMDTLTVQFLYLSSRRQLKELFQSNKISEIEYNNFNYGIYAISGRLNGKQLFVLDSNNDLDFSNENIFSVDLDFRERLKTDLSARDSLPTISVIHNSINNDTIFIDTTFVKVFPYKNYFTYNEISLKNKVFTDYQLVAQTSQHWKSEFVNDEIKYKLALNKINPTTFNILIGEYNSLVLNPANPEYSVQKKDDTIKLKDDYYKIEKINLKKNSLILTKLNIKELFGYKKGETIYDIKFNDINEKEIIISELLKEKKYLLIDFWGTWCAPCLEATPDLINLYDKYNFEVLGVAFNSEMVQVENYIEKNEISWVNTLENPKRDNRSHFVDKFKITKYPTYILINENMQILYRGSAKSALQDIEIILSKVSKQH